MRALALAVALAAAAMSATANEKPLAGDMTIGAINAPVEVIEYASLTCPHCRDFHRDVVEPLRAKYVATGKVRWVFRELPTPPVQIAVAAFQLARCEARSPVVYFDRLKVLFAEQDAIFTALEARQGRAKFDALAAGFSLKPAQLDACLNQPDIEQRINEAGDAAQRQGVTSTPALFVSGALVPLSDHSAEGMTRHIEAALAASARAKKRR